MIPGYADLFDSRNHISIGITHTTNQSLAPGITMPDNVLNTVVQVRDLVWGFARGRADVRGQITGRISFILHTRMAVSTAFSFLTAAIP